MEKGSQAAECISKVHEVLTNMSFSRQNEDTNAFSVL